MINLSLPLLALNPIAFNLGPIQVHWYGIIIATGVVFALILSVREGQRRGINEDYFCLLYTSPSPRDLSTSRMPSSA